MKIEELDHIEWNAEAYGSFINLLQSLSDEAYGKFNSRIIPDIGFSYYVRMPMLRKIARKVEKNKDLESFYNFVSAGSSYEEKLLQGMLMYKVNFKSFSHMMSSIDCYIKKVNNWALCDSFVSNIRKLVEGNKEEFLSVIPKYIKSTEPWSVRFALVTLNNYYTEEVYLDFIFDSIQNIENHDYYVNMGVAWLISTCYLVNKEKTKIFIQSGQLDDWCINKAIQKIVESLRVSLEEKEEIKKLRKSKK
ncbi:MAG: DNA alkylation repair protein [Clostridiales bacterium]|uniref:DNA alkylation repair protein n=1 Tax=Clostridium sp. N3C TaxID=1776758 RepID=UPI00092DFA03|nr:DNA alkylation repair protein [Clostridium sp. N3C]NLZ49935.1 DNA alkylation repair protein [Clostridiales bacterium]SCN22588.1 DNA alkylation repair enzyme [Clostridium sp. N3C]